MIGGSLLKANLARRVNMGFLGAVNGVLYSATMILLIWWWRAYADERSLIESAMSGDYINLVSNERWIPIVIIWSIAFTSASLSVDHFWQNRRASILFWEVVGAVAIVAWNVFALLGTWLDKQAGDTLSYSRVTSGRNPLFGPFSLAVVIGVNFVYGYLVQTFCRTLKQR